MTDRHSSEGTGHPTACQGDDFQRQQAVVLTGAPCILTGMGSDAPASLP